MKNKKQIQAKIQVLQDRYAEIKEMTDEEYTDEVRAELTGLVKEIKDLKQDLDNLAQADSIMDELSKPEDTADPLFNQIHDETNQKPQNTDQQNIQVSKHEYRDFGDQLMDVFTVANVNAMSDQRQKAVNRLEDIRNAATGLGETVQSDGGFLVQTDFVSTLMRDAYDTGKLVSSCSPLPITSPSNGAKIPGIDETSRANGSRWGGVRTYWEGEGDEMTASKLKFREIELRLRKLTGLCYATDEMLQDAPLMGAYINMAFAEEFGFAFDDAIVRGTGAGQPLGILNAGAKVSVAKESGQSADSIVAENIMKAYSRMDPRSLSRAKWYVNQECWPQIFQLHLAVGTGGVPLYIEPGKLPDAPNGALLGRPIVPIEQCSALGDAGDIVFADLSRYIWADKGQMQAATSIHVRFLYNETAFKFVVRVDGQPMQASPITPYKGSATVSPFVTLANRA